MNPGTDVGVVWTVVVTAVLGDGLIIVVGSVVLTGITVCMTFSVDPGTTIPWLFNSTTVRNELCCGAFTIGADPFTRKSIETLLVEGYERRYPLMKRYGPGCSNCAAWCPFTITIALQSAWSRVVDIWIRLSRENVVDPDGTMVIVPETCAGVSETICGALGDTLLSVIYRVADAADMPYKRKMRKI
jgi:hypothetical protein